MLRVLEEGTTCGNREKLCIGLTAEAVRKHVKEVDLPLTILDYCVERRTRVHSIEAKNLFKLHNSNHYATLLGEEGKKSNLCKHLSCNWCYYGEKVISFLLVRKR